MFILKVWVLVHGSINMNLVRGRINNVIEVPVVRDLIKFRINFVRFS